MMIHAKSIDMGDHRTFPHETSMANMPPVSRKVVVPWFVSPMKFHPQHWTNVMKQGTIISKNLLPNRCIFWGVLVEMVVCICVTNIGSKKTNKIVDRLTVDRRIVQGKVLQKKAAMHLKRSCWAMKDITNRWNIMTVKRKLQEPRKIDISITTKSRVEYWSCQNQAYFGGGADIISHDTNPVSPSSFFSKQRKKPSWMKSWHLGCHHHSTRKTQCVDPKRLQRWKLPMCFGLVFYCLQRWKLLVYIYIYIP